MTRALGNALATNVGWSTLRARTIAPCACVASCTRGAMAGYFRMEDP
jgi:hypothetical protein